MPHSKLTEHLGHVTLAGDFAGEYLVEEAYPDGSLVIAPVTSVSTTPTRGGGRDATREEFAAFEAQYGPFLPPDGEG
jgi:hypothetical protein